MVKRVKVLMGGERKHQGTDPSSKIPLGQGYTSSKPAALSPLSPLPSDPLSLCDFGIG